MLMDKRNGPNDLKKSMISWLWFYENCCIDQLLDVYIEKPHVHKKSFSLSFPVMTSEEKRVSLSGSQGGSGSVETGEIAL